MDLDTLKSVAIGSGGITIQFLDMLPEMIRVAVGIVTIIYFGYKIALIRKELKNLKALCYVWLALLEWEKLL